MDLRLKTRKVVGYFKWSLMDHLGRNMETRGDEGDVECGYPQIKKFKMGRILTSALETIFVIFLERI